MGIIIIGVREVNEEMLEEAFKVFHRKDFLNFPIEVYTDDDFRENYLKGVTFKEFSKKNKFIEVPKINNVLEELGINQF